MTLKKRPLNTFSPYPPKFLHIEPLSPTGK
jgi:hypothetical protein